MEYYGFLCFLVLPLFLQILILILIIFESGTDPSQVLKGKETEERKRKEKEKKGKEKKGREKNGKEK